MGHLVTRACVVSAHFNACLLAQVIDCPVRPKLNLMSSFDVMNLLENLELFSSRAALIAWNFADLQ